MSSTRQIVLLWASLLVFGVNSIFADSPPPLGLPVNGLKATISVEKETSTFKDLQVKVSLINVSNSPIEIDPWPGDWFITVSDENGNIVSDYTRVVDQVRPMPIPKFLQPGEKWDTEILGLRLQTGLGNSTPDWEYASLKPGVYWLGAEYTAMLVSARPKMWVGRLDTNLIKITVTKN